MTSIRQNEKVAPRHELLSKAMDFASFLLEDKTIAGSIKNIVLFGSVARGQHDNESDIDIFLDVYEDGKIESLSKKRLDMWEIGQESRNWELKRVKNPISLHVGKLEEWKSLERSIITGGIMLYGKYVSPPSMKLQHHLLVTLELPHKPVKNIMSIRRELFGYRQKIGSKVYISNGLLEKLSGKRIGRNAIIVPIDAAQHLYNFLRKCHIKYSIMEVWVE